MINYMTIKEERQKKGSYKYKSEQNLQFYGLSAKEAVFDTDIKEQEQMLVPLRFSNSTLKVLISCELCVSSVLTTAQNKP